MAREPTRAEWRKANDTVEWWLLIAAWREILGRHEDPPAAAGALANKVTAELEAFLAKHVRGDDADFTMHLAIDAMERNWRLIRQPFPEQRRLPDP